MIHPGSPHRSARHRRAFTLVEAAISTMIVGVMVTAALSVVGTSARGATSERDWRRAQSLASAMMAEVLACGFNDPQGGATFGVDAAEVASSRSTFDDVDDFDGYSENPPLDYAGEKVTWAAGWTRAVSVENVRVDNPDSVVADGTPTGLKRITVTVTAADGKVRQVSALKGRVNVIDARPVAVGLSHVVNTRITLRVGRSGSTLLGGATIFNTPPATLTSPPVAAPKK